MLKIKYFGHSAFQLSDGSTTLVVDPFLTGNPHTKTRAEEVNADYVLLTHAHGDHVGDGIAIAKRCGATVVSVYELCLHCARQGCQVHPMHVGGAHDFPFGRVKLTIAHHGSSIETEEGPRGLCVPCGMVISMGGKTVHHSGDTGLFLDMKLIGERNALDIAFLPIGDNFTMGIDDALKAAEFLNPLLVVPMHYNTFPVIACDPQEFKKRAEAAGQPCRVMEFDEEVEF